MLKDIKSAGRIAEEVAIRNEAGLVVLFAGLFWRYRVAIFSLLITILFMT